MYTHANSTLKSCHTNFVPLHLLNVANNSNLNTADTAVFAKAAEIKLPGKTSAEAEKTHNGHVLTRFRNSCGFFEMIII